jgi:hypothetical protein
MTTILHIEIHSCKLSRRKNGVSGTKIIKWLVALAVLCILVAPAPALPAQSVHIERECPLMSGSCDNPAPMNCKGMMNCCGKCPNEPHRSQGSTCQISLFSSIVVSDSGYSYFSKGSSSPYGKDYPSTSSLHSITESISPSPSLYSSDGVGPPDLDVIEYLPSSAKLVFDVLASEGPLTQKDLISKTELHTNTVRYALGKLKEEGMIRECFYFPDARQSLYRLNTADSKAGRK